MVLKPGYTIITIQTHSQYIKYGECLLSSGTYATFTPASDWAAENLDSSQRSHPLVPVIRGLHLHERPIEMLIAMERPIGLRVITTNRIGCTRLKRVSMN